jgi:hypothetical protein
MNHNRFNFSLILIMAEARLDLKVAKVMLGFEMFFTSENTR